MTLVSTTGEALMNEEHESKPPADERLRAPLSAAAGSNEPSVERALRPTADYTDEPVATDESDTPNDSG
jgi:hypothetical protein